jgi:KDO2-lipid IV(A) lauroyltransferase
LAKRKITPFQRFLYILEYIVVVPIATVLSLIPRRIFYFIGGLLARVLFRLPLGFKALCYKSLDIIFKDPPLSWEEKTRIVKNLYLSIVRYGIEYSKLREFNAKNYEKFAVLEGYGNIDKALSLGKGLIVVTAHIGNWEYLGGVPALLGKNVAVIINRQFNPYTDVWLKNIREKHTKMKNLYNEVGDLKKIIRHIKQGGAVAFVNDQTYYFKPIFVPFFGLPAATADGPARFHLLYGAPIMMAFSIRRPDGKYILRYEEAVSFPPSGDIEKDCAEITAWINRQYEKIILEHPDQWFSLGHGRWERTKPEDFFDCEWDPY